MSSAAVVVNRESSESTNWRLEPSKDLKVNQDHCDSNTGSTESLPADKAEFQTSEDCIRDHQECKNKSENAESSCNEEKFGCNRSGCASSCGSCHCGCSNKRRCSTSDIKAVKSCDVLLTNLAKKANFGKAGADKVDKINLANLVFNPNFKTNNGCVNLPVIRAGQNLAQKNAQRKSTSDLTQLTQQDALDLIAQQLQPTSLTKLNAKIQKLAQQKLQGNGSSSGYSSEDSNVDVNDILQSITTKGQAPSQNNAARYKTELCRSYQEGGECRFGAACTFAHGPEELRPVPRHPLYKTELCRTYHQHGYCQYGTRCHFIHDADEADKNAPLKGCKSWGRHDQLSGALLSLASSSGILDSESAAKQGSSENDVLLANLRRLYALSTHNQEKDQSNQFSSSQPLGHQLSMAHQQFSSTQPLPLSMTQPLPMEALQMGIHRANQMNARGHMSSNRVESLANDYANWGVNPPPSPTYPGISPFGSYQQFSPLPHHPAAGPHQGYPQYPFSATAPDLSAALNVSPYTMSPPTFSNTVNVGHILPEQNQNFPPHSMPPSGNKGSSHAVNSLPNQVWPQTSAEVSSAIDRELFGFGLDSQQGGQQQNGYQHFQPPYFQSAGQFGHQAPGQQQHQHPSQSEKSKQRTSGAEILNFINQEKYMQASGEGGNPQGLKSIREVDDVGMDQQGVRPKLVKGKSLSSSNRRPDVQTEL